MNADELVAHLRHMVPDIRVLPLDRLRQDLTLGCVDGRNPGCVAGAPGGNAGLLVLLLASVEELTGRVFDGAEVKALFQRYLQRFGHFYLHSDRPALASLGRALPEDYPLDDSSGDPSGDPSGDLSGNRPVSAGSTPAGDGDADAVEVESDRLEALLRDPPAALRARLLELLVVPEHVGCGHLRLLLSEPLLYQARPELTSTVIETFFEALWTGDERVIFDVLPGDHHEEAVVRIHAGSPELLVACPHYGAMEFFVHHPDAVGWVEMLQALFAAQEGWILPDQVQRLMEVQERLGNHQLQATLERLAPGLPVFDVHLEASRAPASAASLPSRIRVTQAGAVPKPGAVPPATQVTSGAGASTSSP